MNQDYICRERAEKHPVEIVQIAEKQNKLLNDIIERIYENRPNIMKNEYIFASTSDGELVWKLKRVDTHGVWFPLDRLPIEFEKMIKGEGIE